jgi:hypothetical protein
MFRVLDKFCQWLQATALSQVIQSNGWIIPTLQTIHILSIGLVIASVLLIDLRIFGLVSRRQPASAVAARFLPTIWWPLPVLLATGSLLIIAEPARSLENPSFQLKMALLIAAILVTLAYQRPLRRDAGYWEETSLRRGSARLLALVSASLWIGIILAGRWIAYTQG